MESFGHLELSSPLYARHQLRDKLAFAHVSLAVEKQKKKKK